MTRGLVNGLANPHPLARGLPAIYLEEDPFTVQLTEAFDEGLAPIESTLDNLAAYFDPRYAPEDFLGWLAGWVAIELDETWDVARRRSVIAQAAGLLRRRGTAGGLAAEILLATGGEVEIVENGASAWSPDPGSPMVGSSLPSLLVRVHVADPAVIDRERVERLVEAAKPAHVPHRVEVVGPEPVAPRGRPPTGGGPPAAGLRGEGAGPVERTSDRPNETADGGADNGP